MRGATRAGHAPGISASTRQPSIRPADVAELVEHGATTIVLSIGVLHMLQVCAETLRELER